MFRFFERENSLMLWSYDTRTSIRTTAILNREFRNENNDILLITMFLTIKYFEKNKINI